jgi:hypothetical protein
VRRIVLASALTGIVTLSLGISVASAGLLNEIVAMDDFFAGSPSNPEGAPMTFDNEGNNTHNVTAVEDGPDGEALFRTGNVSGGTTNRPIGGVEFLSADTYDFICTIHPGTMQGTLTITDSAEGPDPRPDVALKIKSKKLEKVVDSGKLKVKVSASEPTDADRVTLSAKKGAKGITKRATLNLNAGDSKTAKLKLKKKAAKKLADLDKAKIKITAEVDFGSPAKASKKLK